MIMAKRIVFSLSDEQVAECLPFVDEEKFIGYCAKQAFLEWVRRRKSRRTRADRESRRQEGGEA